MEVVAHMKQHQWFPGALISKNKSQQKDKLASQSITRETIDSIVVNGHSMNHLQAQNFLIERWPIRMFTSRTFQELFGSNTMVGLVAATIQTM